MTVEVIKTEAAVSQQEETLKVVDVVEATVDLKKEIEASPKVEKSSSFKEESNIFSDLKDHEKKALNELKSKLEEAILGNNLLKKDNIKVVEEEKLKVEEEDKTEEKQSTTPIKEEMEEPKKEGDEEVEEGEKAEEKEKPQEGEEEKKIVEKKGLNELKSKVMGAFKGHNLFRKKASKKEVEEEKPKAEEKEGEIVEATVEVEAGKKEESKPEGDEEEVKKGQECEEEKKPVAVVEVGVTKIEETTEEEKKPEEGVEVVVDKDISIWGVPLLPSKADEGTDVVLLKFLRARDFKVNEAFEMLRKTLEWRKEWKIDSILDEDLGNDLASAAYMSGVDREGHPICYNIFGVLDNGELFQKTFGSEEKRDFFLRWRFQLMEKGIQKLELKPAGVTSLLQINDLNNSPGPAKKEVRVAIKQAVALLQDNYPEFVSRNLIINAPFWYYAFHAILSPFLTQRTKSKFVVARPAKVTETLLKYIPIEEIPIQYGGLKRDSDFEFSAEDGVASELVIKAASSAIIEISAPEAGTTFIWDITVLGWEVNYKEEFVPSDECSYSIIVSKGKKLSATEGTIRNTFRTSEPGKIVLTVENSSSKKRKVFYRHKVKKSAF